MGFGVRLRGGEESILPKAPRRCLPLLGLSPPQVSLAHGPLGAGALGPYRPRCTPYSPCAPPGQVDPPVDPRTPFGTPGTIPIKCETFPATKTGLPIYKSLPPAHSGTPCDVRDLIWDSEQHSVTTYKTSFITLASSNLKCVDPTGSGDMQT